MTHHRPPGTPRKKDIRPRGALSLPAVFLFSIRSSISDSLPRLGRKVRLKLSQGPAGPQRIRAAEDGRRTLAGSRALSPLTGKRNRFSTPIIQQDGRQGGVRHEKNLRPTVAVRTLALRRGDR